MKKWLGVLFAAVLAVGLFFLLPEKADAATSGIYTYEVSNGQATITDCDSSASGSIAIPSKLGGYPVTSIGNYAFRYCSGLTSIAIPDSVTSIGNVAFSDCASLTSITVTSGNTKYHSAGNCLIETASKTLIAGCKTSIIPTDGSVTSIGDSAFQGCSDLTSITIPNGVTSIGASAFCDCTDLEFITLPGSVASIGNHAFSRCVKFKVFTLPGGVTSIGSNAFWYCEGLTSITIPSRVTSIGNELFFRCPNLTSITVASGNTTYHSDGNCLIETASKTLIAGCKTSVIPLDGSVTSIGMAAFSAHTGLTSITIPKSVTRIEHRAFYGCTGLTSITIPDGVTSIEGWAFRGCTGLTSITIPNSVTSIGNYAFDGCTGLTSITIPKSVTRIEQYAFSGCTGLTSITIPDSVTSIGGWTFRGCRGLTSITIPDSVTSIGGYAFWGCSGLTSITIPDSVTSIGQYAFSGCTGLKSVGLPDSLTSVGNGAFRNCSALKTVYYEGTATQWSSIQIGSDNDCLKNATVFTKTNAIQFDQTIHEHFAYLAKYYPSYLNQEAIERLFSIHNSICNDVIQEYNGAETLLLSYVDCFVNGTQVLTQNALAAIGIGQSTREEWLEKNTMSFVKQLQDTSTSLAAISDAWKVSQEAYKGLKTILGSASTLSKATFINEVAKASPRMSYEAIKKMTDELFKKTDDFGLSTTKKIFEGADYAVSIFDVALYTVQLTEVEITTLERLQRLIPSNTPLYEGVTNLLNEIKRDPGAYAIDRFLTKTAVKESAKALGKLGDWIGGAIWDIDITITSKLVQFSAKILYEYAYQGAKIDELYGAIIAYDFYASVNIARMDLLNQLLNCRINGVLPTEQMISDYEYLWGARCAALQNYAEACKTINKYSEYNYPLQTILNDVAGDGILSFPSYVNYCYNRCTSETGDEKPLTYSVNYSANGGSGAPAAQTKEYGIALTLSSVRPTKTCAIRFDANRGDGTYASSSVSASFNGWNTAQNGSGTAYAPGSVFNSNSNLSLYAQWTHSTVGTLPTLTREGHSFNGWYTSPSGGNKISTSTVVTGPVTYYAQWTAYTYTVSYHANGGTGAPGSQVKTYGAVLDLSSAAPTRAGYLFRGWAVSSSADRAEYAPGASFNRNANTALYAVWEKIELDRNARISGRTLIFDSTFTARYLVRKDVFDAYLSAGMTVDSFTVTVNGETKDVSSAIGSDQVFVADGVEYYWVKVEGIAPKDADTELCFSLACSCNGETYTDSYSDSVQAALTQVSVDETGSAFADAANATLAYCKAAAEAFGKTSDAAFDPVPDITTYTEIQNCFEGEGAIRFCGTSLLLKDELAIKFWAKKGEYTGSLDDLTLKINGETVAAEKAENGGYLTFRISVPVDRAKTALTAELFANGESVSNRYTDSVLNYALSMTGDAAPLGQAIVNYVHYSNAYLETLAA